jgi:hypothetical protein
MNSPTPNLRTADDVRTIAVDNSVVLVDQKTGQYFGLNEVGGAIWAMLNEGRTTQEIVDRLAQEYEANYEVIVDDAQRLVGKLIEVGLLREADKLPP